MVASTRADEHPGEIAIVVRDSGVDIAAADIPPIWGRLYRGDKGRADRGLGPGLSLVKAIVQAHGGRLEVDSRSGTVDIQLFPASRAPI